MPQLAAGRSAASPRPPWNAMPLLRSLYPARTDRPSDILHAWPFTETITITCCTPRNGSPGGFYGQPASPFPAVALSICHRLDGGESFRSRAHGALRCGAASGRSCLPRAAARNYWEPGADSLLARAVVRDLKGKLSPVLYGTAIAAAFFEPWIPGSIYVLVALMWLAPDRRIEHVLDEKKT